MCGVSRLILFLTIFAGTKCVTFENVTLILTTRWTIYFVNETAPEIVKSIRFDDSLVEYVNNQPFEIVKILGQNVPELSKNSVAGLPKIEEVVISESGLRNIQPGAFRNLPLLEYLNLSGNLLEEIRDGVFADLPKLNTIILVNNRISKLGDRVFNNLPWMNHLFIDNNQISNWKSEWFSGSPVRSVAMGYNLIEELPENAFSYYVELFNDSNARLWYLELNNNKLKSIHPDAFKGLVDVGYLNLQGNLLEELKPGVFNTVKEINNLVLSDNKIAEIDVNGVFKNTNLTYVRLKNNRLTCVSIDIVKTDIYNLNMDGNPLKCECVESWKNWINHSGKSIVPLDNIKENCIE